MACSHCGTEDHTRAECLEYHIESINTILDNGELSIEDVRRLEKSVSKVATILIRNGDDE